MARPHRALAALPGGPGQQAREYRRAAQGDHGGHGDAGARLRGWNVTGYPATASAPRPSSHRWARVHAASIGRAPRLVTNNSRPPAARPAAPTAAGGAPAGARVLAVPVVPHSAAAVRMAVDPDSGARRARGRATRGEREGLEAARERSETRGEACSDTVVISVIRMSQGLDSKSGARACRRRPASGPGLRSGCQSGEEASGRVRPVGARRRQDERASASSPVDGAASEPGMSSRNKASVPPDSYGRAGAARPGLPGSAGQATSLGPVWPGDAVGTDMRDCIAVRPPGRAGWCDPGRSAPPGLRQPGNPQVRSRMLTTCRSDGAGWYRRIPAHGSIRRPRAPER